MEIRTGARVKASMTLGFGSVPKGTLGTIGRIFTGKDGKLRIIVEWDNRVENQWAENTFHRWIDAAVPS